jgi:hypothetical protein
MTVIGDVPFFFLTLDLVNGANEGTLSLLGPQPEFSLYLIENLFELVNQRQLFLRVLPIPEHRGNLYKS